MLKRFSLAAAMLGTVAIATPGFAQSFSPSSGFVTGTGVITYAQSYFVNCQVSITVNPLSASSAPIPGRTITPGSLLCYTVVPDGSWKIDVVPGSTTSIAFTLGTTSGQACYGTIVVAWSNAASAATFNNNVLPPVNPGDPPCTIVAGSIRIPGLQII